MSEQRVTTLVRRYYQRLLRMHHAPMGFFDMTLRQWVSTLGLALFLWAVGGAVVVTTSQDWAGWGICGMGLGALLRDIGIRRRSVASWPLLDAVIDWRRVELLVKDSDESS